MRILFVLDRVENPASANAQLACRLAEQLLAQGHEIHLLELWDGENPPPAPPAGASQHTLAFADERLRQLPVKLIIAGEFYEDAAPYEELIRVHGLESRLVRATDFICKSDSTAQGPAIRQKLPPPICTPPTDTTVSSGWVWRDAKRQGGV